MARLGGTSYQLLERCRAIYKMGIRQVFLPLAQ